MPKHTPPTHPRAARQLAELGRRLRAARLRRKLSQALVAERVGVSEFTLRKLEAGDPSVSLATLVRLLTTLGLAGDLDKLATDDPLGRELQDAQRQRAPARRSSPDAEP